MSVRREAANRVGRGGWGDSNAAAKQTGALITHGGEVVSECGRGGSEWVRENEYGIGGGLQRDAKHLVHNGSRLRRTVPLDSSRG
jgi:hypothetical protein